ncbi:putative PBS lyase HEAT-like repeat protein [Hyella patelloides LEGE 07179]|uniref:Putative PBS lyase HEAT-like repeat protein n=1 Tax=Hyella patelloides LEGE 07179 TaxID=945734 RepID=A0A563VWX9_9CYAN|nr:hypothetical protein [Hyella patelloides]VEP15930.1 putative PBS lyase HEAT-like repeat protein [Hyella patelloides LEGE 07179]
MSVLVETLDRCLKVLKDNHHNAALNLQVGLSLEKIEDTTNLLLYKIPQEIQELYQWRNGMKYGGIFYSPYGGTLTFHSLEKAVEKSFSFNGFELIGESIHVEELHLFSSIDRWFPFAAWDKEEKTPIFTVTDDYSVRIAYTSLTNMMLVHAECYEKGLFTFEYSGREVSLKKGNDIKK